MRISDWSSDVCSSDLALAEHDGIGARRVAIAQILALEEAGEMERHPGDALADALGHQRPDLGLGAVLRAVDPDPLPFADTAFGRVGRVDLDEHLLLQLGEALVRPRYPAPAFVFDQPAADSDYRKFPGVSTG